LSVTQGVNYKGLPIFWLQNQSKWTYRIIFYSKNTLFSSINEDNNFTSKDRSFCQWWMGQIAINFHENTLNTKSI